ncbi:acyl-CoA N-acyltransferase [Dendrothele bispora CBS 962.96]|uniref:Acyl-CoA N-acyltransferase n=1 Tax=Dendrothele bispora (strain CBS 962.96) TaxID=1314807 RepID=A0A4S8MIZ2_DENBC|nr:acyl-CoA N-acyltransferase [Dendrothele bispora CBS 962.96]
MSPEKPIQLKSRTGRIVLVRPDESHDELIRQLRTDSVTRKYIRFLPEKLSLDEVKKMREERGVDPATLNLNVFQLDGSGSVGQFVGSTGIFHIDEENSHCEMGILLLPDFHRGGFGTDILFTFLSYAFEERRYHRVAFETGADNVNMRGWLEKVAGAKLEGTRRDHWKDLATGDYSDVLSYSILEQEWKDSVKEKLEKRLRL